MALPPEVRPYSRSPEFTEASVPAALRKAHSTKEGAWALIHVLEGQLAYRVEDPRRSPSEVLLTPGAAPGVVEPTILHSVEPRGPVRFFVEFYRQEHAGDAQDEMTPAET